MERCSETGAADRNALGLALISSQEPSVTTAGELGRRTRRLETPEQLHELNARIARMGCARLL